MFRRKKITSSYPVFIFSEGRGGSTWLMEVINFYKNGITIFEPFGGRAFGFTPIQRIKTFPFYADSGNETDIVQKFLSRVASLKGVENRNVRFNTITEALFNEGMVVKVVNKTLLLPYLIELDFFRVKPILLIRNPVEIIQSRAKYGFKGFEKETKVDMEKIWNLCNNHPIQKHINFFKTLNTNYELYIAEWCLSNAVFINSSRFENKVNVIYYDNMKFNAKDIFDNLINEYDWTKKDDYDFTKKSVSTSRAFKKNVVEFSTLPNFDSRVSEIFDYFEINKDRFLKER